MSRDRTTPDDLRCDFVFSSTDHTFSVDLANGDYEVTIIVGDQNYGHDLIDVYAEDTLKINDLITTAGTFQEQTFWVTIADGQLNIRIEDDGEAPFWVLNALTIEPGVPPTLPTEGSFDFGSSGSPVETDYTQVTPSTQYTALQGYGWTATGGLMSRDRTTPDDLRCDFVFSSTDHTFSVDLANGDYEVTIIVGDQNYGHDLIDVYAEDTLKINDLITTAGTFQEQTFWVTIADGQLNITIHDDGGAGIFWVLNAITITPTPP